MFIVFSKQGRSSGVAWPVFSRSIETAPAVVLNGITEHWYLAYKRGIRSLSLTLVCTVIPITEEEVQALAKEDTGKKIEIGAKTATHLLGENKKHDKFSQLY